MRTRPTCAVVAPRQPSRLYNNKAFTIEKQMCFYILKITYFFNCSPTYIFFNQMLKIVIGLECRVWSALSAAAPVFISIYRLNFSADPNNSSTTSHPAFISIWPQAKWKKRRGECENQRQGRRQLLHFVPDDSALVLLRLSVTAVRNTELCSSAEDIVIETGMSPISNKKKELWWAAAHYFLGLVPRDTGALF